MVPKSSSARLLAVSIALYAVLVTGCPEKLKNAGKLEEISKRCFEIAGFNGTNMPNRTDMADPDFDDKGAIICILTSIDLVTEDKKFDKDEFMEMIEEEAPPELASKLIEMTNKCSDVAELYRADEEANPEKIYWKFFTCFYANSEKLC